MFEKYLFRRNRFLPVLHKVMEGQEFGRLLAEQGLRELCVLLGDKVDLMVSISVKNMENYVFSTLPEDEARYYLWNPEETCTDGRGVRIKGRKALKFILGLKGILSGIWVLEVPERTGEEEISEYKDLVLMTRAFLYCCFLKEVYENEQERDCFTGLPGDRRFEEDLRNTDADYLLVVHACKGRNPAEDLNASVRAAAGCCKSVCSGKSYRIGPDVVSVLYYGDKAGAMAAIQDLMRALPDCSFLMEPLSGANKDSMCDRIRKWCMAYGNEISFPRCEGVYPKLPVFEEEAV